MKSLRSWSLCLALAVIAVCPIDFAFADGKFFRRMEVVDEPGIRAQRAVVAFKDGIETIIVQSDMEGEGESYGWLLPLPAEPTSIEPCRPSSLNVLGDFLRPTVAVYPRALLLITLSFTLLIVAACLDHLRRKSQGQSGVSVAGVLFGMLLIALIASLMLPSLGGARGPVDGVDVLQAAKVGVYDVVIIKGETGGAVDEWLTSNGFASPDSAESVIGEYITDGWCFLAAKISASEAGNAATASHHPLKVTFPATEAIYPLKLTGSDGEPIQLDLTVIAELRASARGMKTWVCDSFRRHGNYRHDFKDYVCEVAPIYKGSNHPRHGISVPEVTDSMWEGCVVTRLHGKLSASDMSEDLKLDWIDAVPTIATLHSPQGSLGWSAVLALAVLAVSFTWFTREAVRSGWSWQTMLHRRLLHAVGFGLLAGGVYYATLEVVPAKSISRRNYFARSVAPRFHLDALEHVLKNPPGQLFPEVYRDFVLADYPDTTIDEVTDLDEAGDFEIVATDDGWRLTIIEWPYIPIHIAIAPDGTPRMRGK